MAKKRGTETKVVYRPTAKAKARPVYFVGNGPLYAIGGRVTLRKTPPKPSVQVPEATQAQLKKAFEAGMTHLVERVEVQEPEEE